MSFAIGINHMGGYGLDITERATLRANEISITHQHDLISLDADDAMHHVATCLYPCQYDIAHLRRNGFLKDNALTSADDKRQHAISVYG